MKDVPDPSEELLDEALSTALLEALRSLPSEQATATPEVDAAVLAEARTSLAALRRPRIRIHFWPVLAVAACIALAFSLFFRPNPTPVAVVPPKQDDKYALILREVSAVFPDQLKAIIAEGGELRIALADEPIADDKQAVVVELCENQKCTTLITYVGQTVEVGRHIVTVREDEKGAIVVEAPPSEEPGAPTTKPEADDLVISTRRI